MGKTEHYTKETLEKILQEKGSKVILLGEYKNCRSKILCQCPINSNHIWETEPWNLLMGTGCPYCDGKLVLPEESLGVERPDLIEYFINKEDAFKYRVQSGKKVDLKCPYCGTLKELKIQELSKKGFSCPNCNDNISFPNKFVRNMLKQINISFSSEWNDSWCSKYKYDIMFELNSNKYLIECDGIYHYESIIGEENLRKQKERDNIKDNLAKQYGYCLIRLDCRDVSGESIFREVLNSPLKDILNFSNFNLEKCIIDSQKSLMIEVCKYYNNNMDKTINEIAKIFEISITTTVSYLKRGKKLNICPYYKNRGYKTKMISVLNKDMIVIETYDSIKECSQKCKLENNLSERKSSWALCHKKGIIGEHIFKEVKTIKDIASKYKIQ